MGSRQGGAPEDMRLDAPAGCRLRREIGDQGFDQPAAPCFVSRARRAETIAGLGEEENGEAAPTRQGIEEADRDAGAEMRREDLAVPSGDAEGMRRSVGDAAGG